MYLKNYIPKLKKKYSKILFTNISFDSSKVKTNDIFFAIKGEKYDGNSYINHAIRNGAKVIVTQKKIVKKKDNIIFLHSSNVRKLLANISYKIFSKRPKKLIAVTGTNGKSSVADFFYQILDLNKKKVASIGTIGVKYLNKKKIISNTTLDPIRLSSILNDLLKKKIEFIIMEASSHGLKQNRLDGLLFDIGIFTNLSHDHLDYHKDMNSYLKSKLYLFEKLIKKKGQIISDNNIPQIKTIKKISSKKNLNLNLISNKEKGIEIISHKFINRKQILAICYKKKRYNLTLNLIGKIQIKNVLMAFLAASKCGIKADKIVNIIHKLKPVEGRLEEIGTIKNNSKVILDYAHSPEALKQALMSIKEQFPNNKIGVVFGCGGERDRKKRSLMGKIADKYSDKIYLTDDNPRSENAAKIRKDIKKGIKEIKYREISDRKKAIFEAITDLKTGDLLLVAGKGHEKTQDYGFKKLFFSDKKIILKSIKNKNKLLSKNLKLNIINEESGSKISNKLVINNISINSKIIKKNDVFFAIKGTKKDGNKYLPDVFKKKSSLAIVNKINPNYLLSKQIKVRNTLSFLNKCSSIFRDNINAKIISVTGSCGKTTLKQMIGLTLKKISKTYFSPNSYNNKYGVPLSLFNLRQNDEFGVFEVGMDKKGEIENLTKIIRPDLGIITNISYAHSKNFNSIKNIAEAKGEIINNIKKNGYVVLNMDDNFYHYHANLARQKKIKVISFSIKNKYSMIKLLKIKKFKNVYNLSINVKGFLFYFDVKNINKSHLHNILATLASIHLFLDIKKLKKDTFLNFKNPEGRGDISKIKLKDKKIFLVDETYNSNPLSLKSAIENFDLIKVKNSEKYVILGDMLELGKHAVKQHKFISKILNKSKIKKIYVIGKYIKETYWGLKPIKRAKILDKKSNIINLINKDLNNNDYLMVKGSNATGLNNIAKNLKKRNKNAI